MQTFSLPRRVTYLLILLYCCFAAQPKLWAQQAGNIDPVTLDSIMHAQTTDTSGAAMNARNMGATNGGIATPKRYLISNFSADIVARDGVKVLEVTALDEWNHHNKLVTGKYKFTINDKKKTLNFTEGKAIAKVPSEDFPQTLFLKHNNGKEEFSSFERYDLRNGKIVKKPVNLVWSILPPLVAILLALVFREVIFSLFLGIWAGVLLLNGFSFRGLLWSFLNTIDKYILNSLTDSGHASIIVFSMLIGGMVAIISRNGGMAGVVNWLSTWAQSARSSQMVTWLMGIAIFFDDYANTLVVGNTMRSVTDKYRVSREKLAYIVDSTAAPVAAIALITTWIGAELGYIADATAQLGITEGSYSIFLNSLAYSFYPIFTLFFILMLVLTRRDFGPMLHAERRARTTGKLSASLESGEELEERLEEFAPAKGAKPNALNAILPILTVIVLTVIGLIYTGYTAFDDFAGEVWNNSALGFSEKISKLIGSSDSYAALLWSSLAGVSLAVLLSFFAPGVSLRSTMNDLANGMKTMLPAVIILVLAWALAQITQDLHTADFLTGALSDKVPPLWLPALTFILAGIIAFSTGSSWSTMAILYPVILPTSWAICKVAGMSPDAAMAIFYNVTACVLAGSVFGDHCSPISDTTILSSLASNCNHIDHVRTQLPYAVTVAIVSVGVGTLSIYLKLGFLLNLLMGLGILFLVALILGRRVKEAPLVFPDEEQPTPKTVTPPTFVAPDDNDDSLKGDDTSIDDWIAEKD